MAFEPSRKTRFLSLGVRIVLCAALSVLLIKLVSDRQQLRWHAKWLHGPDAEKCPDLLMGPEPRLDWPQWEPFAELLAEEVEEADKSEGYDVLFYGDSITEQWRGSCVNVPYPNLRRTQDVFNDHFNRNYSSHVLAIAGDQIGHLWWRFLNGDIPVAKHPKAAVVLIGTNDMTADDCHQTEKASMRAVTGVVSRLKGALSLLREKLPETQIVLLGLLPRDAHVLSGPPIFEWPNRMSNALALANSEFEKLAAADTKMHYLDCGAPFLLEGGGLDSSLLPDALHPNTEGMETVAQCLQPLLDRLVLPFAPAAVPQGA